MSDDEKAQSDVPEYKVGKKVALDDLLKQDQEDESLRKYKESLLGKLDDAAARMPFLLLSTPILSCLLLPFIHSLRFLITFN